MYRKCQPPVSPPIRDINLNFVIQVVAVLSIFLNFILQAEIAAFFILEDDQANMIIDRLNNFIAT